MSSGSSRTVRVTRHRGSVEQSDPQRLFQSPITEVEEEYAHSALVVRINDAGTNVKAEL